MPASRSPSRGASAPTSAARPARSRWPWILIGVAAVLAVAVAALPASLVSHFLPPSVQAGDFSGSLWHGSAGTIRVNAHDAGALEWRLHPAALMKLGLAADLHWVKVGFVVDGAATVDRGGLSAGGITGGGPIEDLHDFGIAGGWRGNADLHFSTLKGTFSKLSAAVGDITVSNLSSAQVANGADLGGYDLRLPEGAVNTDGSINMDLTDTGGPLELQAHIRFSPAEHTGLLSGTLKERAGFPAGLASQLDSLAQVRGRDPQGRIPIDLEFNF